MGALDDHADEELLAMTRRSNDADAFAAFYSRYCDLVLAYFARRTGSAELAADLMMETFAGALLSAQAGRGALPDRAAAWLFGIARHVLADSYRRGIAESQARRRLGLEPTWFDDEDLRRIDELTDEQRVMALLGTLAPDQRHAVLAYVVDDRSHARIASDLGCSALVVRKRVSRGLGIVRAALGSTR